MQINDMMNMYNNQSVQTSPSNATANTASVSNMVKSAMNSLSNLPVGSVFEGSITSVKDGVVTLGLSNGQNIQAKLDQGVSLSQGQSMFFEVKSNSSGQIYISPYKGNIMGNPMLETALQSAGLAATGKNLTMVHTMMDESMSIDAKSLQQMAQTIANLPDTEIATAVAMQKLGIPVNETNIAQFINYSADKYEITAQLNELMETIPKAFESGSMTMEEAVNLSKGMLDIFYPESEAVMGEKTAAEGNVMAAAENAGGEGQAVIVGGAGSEVNANAATNPEAVNGNGVANPEAANANVAVNPETANANGVANPEATNANVAANSEAVNANVAANPETANANGVANPEAANANVETNPEAVNADVAANSETANANGAANPDATNANVTNNPETASAHAANNPEATNTNAANILDRQILGNMLSDINGKDYFSGEKSIYKMNPDELMGEIKNALNSDADMSKLAKLVGSRQFRKLFSETIDKSWTVKPEELKEKDKVSELYKKMDDQLGKLEQLLSGKSPVTKELNNIVSETRANIQFMNDVNHAYTFVQIPLKMSGQNVNSELYVMTNKKNLNNPDNEITAYLHLDMEHLGSTDVFIKMLRKNVTTNFFLEDDKSYDLIEKNLPALQERLNNLGYNTTINIKNDRKDISFVDDFLKAEETKNTNRISRYSFDVRM
ncbi:MAG: flagellar hook-length control protein FliK [Lachnospiraceae bacterium]|nr:flagellar hook-length control protein FliK [Lachnospiraceae bacterium]